MGKSLVLRVLSPKVFAWRKAEPPKRPSGTSYTRTGYSGDFSPYDRPAQRCKVRKRGKAPSTVTEPTTKITSTASDAKAAHLGFMRQLGLVVRAIFSSPVGKTLIVLMAIILVII